MSRFIVAVAIAEAAAVAHFLSSSIRSSLNRHGIDWIVAGIPVDHVAGIALGDGARRRALLPSDCRYRGSRHNHGAMLVNYLPLGRHFRSSSISSGFSITASRASASALGRLLARLLSVLWAILRPVRASTQRCHCAWVRPRPERRVAKSVMGGGRSDNAKRLKPIPLKIDPAQGFHAIASNVLDPLRPIPRAGVESVAFSHDHPGVLSHLPSPSVNDPYIACRYRDVNRKIALR